MKIANVLFLLLLVALAMPLLAQEPPEAVAPLPPHDTQSGQMADQALQADLPQADVVLPQGTQVAIRLNRNHKLKLNSAKSAFQATLSEDLLVGDEMVAPRGTPVRGELVQGYDEQDRPEPALSLTEIWLRDDWRSLYTDLLPLEARTSSGGGLSKFLGGLSWGAVVYGESSRGYGRRRCSRRPARRVGIGVAVGTGSWGGISPSPSSDLPVQPEQKVKLKRGQQFRFELLEAVAFDQR